MYSRVNLSAVVYSDYMMNYICTLNSSACSDVCCDLLITDNVQLDNDWIQLSNMRIFFLRGKFRRKVAFSLVTGKMEILCRD